MRRGRMYHVKKGIIITSSPITNTTTAYLMNQQQPPADMRPNSLAAKCWLEDDIDLFLNTLSDVKAKGVRPDLIASLITHYACKWIPELSATHHLITTDHQSATASSWLKKRFLIETILSVLPPQKHVVANFPCNFCLRLLKTSNMVGVDSNYREELEKMVASRLDQATLQDLMIPSFASEGTLLDVELMLRLVNGFVETVDQHAVGMFKVAKLVDAYLAEAAVDPELALPVFMELAAAVPAEARASHDGLYRAIDIYLKAHVKVTKQERKMLCRLMESQKLSVEASLHAAQNERLPVRSVIQLVLFSEQGKLHGIGSTGGGSLSCSSNKSPLMVMSSRDNIMTLQHMEIKKLKQNIAKLERQCHLMQLQIGKLSEKKRIRMFFSWRKPATAATPPRMEIIGDDDSCSIGKQTPLNRKHGSRYKAWRQSSSYPS